MKANVSVFVSENWDFALLRHNRRKLPLARLLLANATSSTSGKMVSKVKTMNTTYIIFKRAGRKNFIIEDTRTGKQTSLKTSDPKEAKEIVAAKNHALETPLLNLALGKAYLSQANPNLVTRTWEEAMTELCTHGKEVSQIRSKRAFKSADFNSIRKKRIIETTSDDLKAVLKRGGAATNNYLRRLHNLAVGNQWVPIAIIPSKQWPKTTPKPVRGITIEEHSKIIAAERNEEKKNYYELVRLVGAAQTDASLLTDKNINWKTRVLSYERQKTGAWAHLKIGKKLKALLKRLPQTGFLFPKISQIDANARSAEFNRRCRVLGIKGITLHSARYSWAERAYENGYPERYAQAALGHKSRAVHHGYAKKAIVVCPALEDAPFNTSSFPSRRRDESTN